MEIDISGIGFGFFSIAVGLAFMGYFIGKGLQNFNQGEEVSGHYTFLKENELEFYLLNLSKDEIKELLNKYPDIPKVELDGSNYYPKKQLMEWLSSNETYKK